LPRYRSRQSVSPIQKIGIRDEVVRVARKFGESKRRRRHSGVKTVTDIDRNLQKRNSGVRCDHSPQRVGHSPPSVGKSGIRFCAREGYAQSPVGFRRRVTPPYDCWEPRPVGLFKPDTHRRMADIPPQPRSKGDVDRRTRRPESNWSKRCGICCCHGRNMGNSSWEWLGQKLPVFWDSDRLKPVLLRVTAGRGTR
jgi:hypothetical protein